MCLKCWNVVKFLELISDTRFLSSKWASPAVSLTLKAAYSRTLDFHRRRLITFFGGLKRSGKCEKCQIHLTFTILKPLSCKNGTIS